MNKVFDNFKNVVVYDYEFKITDGNPPSPVCVVYKELHSQKIIKQWLLDEVPRSPFSCSDTLFIAHFSNAEVDCDICRAPAGALQISRSRNIFGILLSRKRN